MFVIMAVVTTLTAVPLVQLVYPMKNIIADDCRRRGLDPAPPVSTTGPTTAPGPSSLAHVSSRGEEAIPLLTNARAHGDTSTSSFV